MVDFNNLPIGRPNPVHEFIVRTHLSRALGRSFDAITVAFPIWSQQHKGPLAAQEQIRAKSRRIPEQAIVDRQCFVSGEYPPLEKRR